jgi:hypothetical protein
VGYIVEDTQPFDWRKWLEDRIWNRDDFLVRPWHEWFNEDDHDDTIVYGRWDDTKLGQVTHRDFFIHSLLSGSDYSGGSVTVSNKRVFLEQFKDHDGVHEVFGGHGTYAVAVRADCLDADICEFFDNIADYPVADENDLSEVESEAEDAAWDSWVRMEFKDALGKLADSESEHGYWWNEWVDLLDDGELYGLFTQFMEETNSYWENEEGNGAYVDIERVMQAYYPGCWLQFAGDMQEGAD